MDIAEMSVAMHQLSLQNSVSISVMKMAMNDGSKIVSDQIENMVGNDNMAMDDSKGNNIDIRV
ncbi:putative motility protein [Clostridium sp. 2-1]|uniref:YjfB family protein n=1 Tax=Clostridium TaxID=1485 RepID=UPI000CDAEB21|nr:MULTISPECIES: YjfB family protein [Clostridium]MBN7573052.1 YjfB family protein [Clostridium beijerinckii]MBN7578391.1 YjfB family protein [Clostridium beijerinckii]MBN7582826.1 YjfB family protein [Clostridium beijerinckii]MBO0518991.1 YjfB family protein [Clostridium beijerinckii]POO93256.1 putative motility protein [Clostridium sp. 2-1]